MLQAPAGRASEGDGVASVKFLLPGQAASATAARVLLGGMLAGFSRLGDALVVVTELMGHAVRECCVCCPSGLIEVVARIGARGVRIEVGFGCSGRHPGQWDEEMVLAYTWGVKLMRHVADRWGLDTSGHRTVERQTWWVEIDGEWP
jgi:hypothetical protein